MRWLYGFFFAGLICMSNATAFETDTFTTTAGPLVITFIGHGTLMMQAGETVIHIDPVSGSADYSALPDADIVLITHEHRDHLDSLAIAAVRKEATRVFCPQSGVSKIQGATVMRNGDSLTVEGIAIRAVPAYNIVHMRDPQKKIPFHEKGSGNGYILVIGGKRVYISGDTENIPEQKTFGRLDIAFISVNLPYTMTVAMAVDAARMLKAKVLYPYHYGTTNVDTLKAELRKVEGIEVRIRQMK